MEWALFGVTFVITFVLIVILGEHLRQKRKLALREIIQKERMAAMEKGLQLPAYNEDILDDGHTAADSAESYRRKVQWFRFTSLSVGIFMIFGGTGFFLGLSLSPNPELNRLATLGAGTPTQ